MVALCGGELRERHTVTAPSASSLGTPTSLRDLHRRPSPSMQPRFAQPQQLVSSGSEESVSSLDKNSVHELAAEQPRLGLMQCQ